MINEDLIAERIAIESYSEIIRHIADNDPTNRRLMEEILANEEEHAEEIRVLLESIGEEEKNLGRILGRIYENNIAGYPGASITWSSAKLAI
jgi:bacterioferritin (cytochrome b1)